MAVRGYTNLLFGRGVYEYCGGSLYGIKRYLVVLNRADVFNWNVYKYLGATVYDVLNPSELKVIEFNGNDLSANILSISGEVALDMPFKHTDTGYIDGISTTFAGFRVLNLERNRNKFVEGSNIYFNNQDKRKIVKVVDNHAFITIFLDGDILDPKKMAIPITFVVE